jgi:hypothetical protein
MSRLTRTIRPLAIVGCRLGSAAERYQQLRLICGRRRNAALRWIKRWGFADNTCGSGGPRKDSAAMRISDRCRRRKFSNVSWFHHIRPRREPSEWPKSHTRRESHTKLAPSAQPSPSRADRRRACADSSPGDRARSGRVAAARDRPTGAALHASSKLERPACERGRRGASHPREAAPASQSAPPSRNDRRWNGVGPRRARASAWPRVA